MDYRSQHFPGNEVDDYYKDIICQINMIGTPLAEQAFQILSWILYAKEPLKKRVLLEAIEETSEEDILRPCMSLVIFSPADEVFQFSHPTTVREFLLNSPKFEFKEMLLSRFELAKRCLKFLNSREFESLSVPHNIYTNFSTIYGFGGYAAVFWVAHVREVEQEQLHILTTNRLRNTAYF